MWLSDVSMQHWVFGGQPRWADSYWVHTRVMRLFGELDGGSVRSATGILYRVEPGLGKGRVLVQSTVAPTDDTVRRIDLAAALGGLQTGDRVGIRVTAHAAKTVNHTTDGVTRKHRVARPPDELEAWFAEISDRALCDVRVEGLETGTERQHKVPIAVATIDLTAVVTDPPALLELVAAGVGKARAFGCGLVSVRLVGHG